jgi:hypothetical protein
MVLIGGLLMIGGIPVCMAGMVWEKTADFLTIFGIHMKKDKALWVMLVGLAMMLGGWGLISLASRQ